MDFIAVNTDAQSLAACEAPTLIQAQLIPITLIQLPRPTTLRAFGGRCPPLLCIVAPPLCIVGTPLCIVGTPLCIVGTPPRIGHIPHSHGGDRDAA